MEDFGKARTPEDSSEAIHRPFLVSCLSSRQPRGQSIGLLTVVLAFASVSKTNMLLGFSPGPCQTPLSQWSQSSLYTTGVKD